MRKFIIYIILTSVIGCAATRYVATSGADTNAGTAAAPYLTIQKGVNVSIAGDTVVVKNGTYGPGAGHCTTTAPDPQNSNILSPDGYAVTISTAASSGSPIVIKAENLRGATLDSGMLCHSYFFISNIATYITIDSFIIQNTYVAGIFSQGNNLTFKHCEFRNIGNIITNTAGAKVGVLVLNGSNNITFDSDIFHHIGRLSPCNTNPAPCSQAYWHDQNLYINGSFVTIVNSIFYDLLAGWAIAITPIGSGTDYNISNNTFDGPACLGCRDGVIQIGDGNGDTVGNVKIRNSIFRNIQRAVVADCPDSTYTGVNLFDHNLLFGSSITVLLPNIITPDVCTGINPQGGLGTITQTNNTIGDPLFVNPGIFNYHLQANSPAIGRGVPIVQAALDFDGFTRSNTSWDLGAFTTPYACDLNKDGRTDIFDVKLVVDMELSKIPCTANINGQGVCNVNTVLRIVTAALGGTCVVGP